MVKESPAPAETVETYWLRTILEDRAESAPPPPPRDPEDER